MCTTTVISQIVCGAVDWQRPELNDGPIHRMFVAGRVPEAALALIRHLRTRRAPNMGYDRAYIDALRTHASAEYTVNARMELDRAIGRNGNAEANGTLFDIRPEIIQVGACAAHFRVFAQSITASMDSWDSGQHNVVGRITRYLQAVWAIEECRDEDLLPLFGFLVTQFKAEWKAVRHWNEALFGTAGHNWWVAEFGWLWMAALLFPEFKGFGQFQAFFPAFFEREMALLIDTDGFTQERSVSYHTGTSDLFLGVLRLAQANGLEPSAAFTERLRKMYEFEWKMITPTGNQPAFGDGFKPAGYEFERVRSIAAILGMSEAKYIAEAMDRDRPSAFGDMLIEGLHYPTVGEDLQPAYAALAAREPASCDHAFKASQYYVMRQNWSRQADYLAIEASSKGNLVTSHGHGCFFDIKLYSRGRHILIGNGKGPCCTTQIEETWRKESMSHNVAVVDGESHLPLRSTYRYGAVVAPVVDRWASEDGKYAYFSGAHESYERLEKKVSCSRRKIFCCHGRYWILMDRFTAASPEDRHEYQQRFQVGVPSRIDGQRVITEGVGGNLLFLPVASSCGKAERAPIPYPYENHPEPDQVTFTKTTNGSTIMIMLLIPFLDDQVPDVTASLLDVQADQDRLVPAWEITGLEIVLDGERDVFVDQHMQWALPWQAADYTGSTRIFHSRFHT